MEPFAGQPDTIDHAKEMTRQLKTFDTDFKYHHCELLDLTEDEEALERKQDKLDEHNEEVTDKSV